MKGRYFMKNIIFIIAGISIALGGCMSGKKVDLDGKSKTANSVQEKKTAVVIEGMPDWVVQLPKADKNKELYVAGTGYSTNLKLARDKAFLDVESQIANKVSAKVSKQVKEYIREIGNGNNPITIQDNEYVTKKVVTEAEVAGYQQEDMAVLREGKGFRVYVLAYYPIEENILRAMQQTEKMVNKIQGDKDEAFEELDNNIDAERKSNGDVTSKEIEAYNEQLDSI